MKFLTSELTKAHKRRIFRCSHESLNNYLKLQATKESKRGLAKIYVFADESNEVVGYYSLSSAELPREAISEDLLRKLPKGYSGYPAILIGRLAVSKHEAGKGLGGELLVDAILRCVIHAESIGTSAILVDPIDNKAISFYEKFMFKALPDSSKMVLKIDHNLKAHFSIE